MNGASPALSTRNRNADQTSSTATWLIGRMPNSASIGHRLSRLMSASLAFGYATRIAAVRPGARVARP